ncbi:MAG: NHLP family bacteriocin export ABC transporter peptidase/permease/ATPase subunit [Acidobacteriota bacterium]
MEPIGAQAAAAAGGETLAPPPDRHVDLPTLIQMENVECGAAALGIVLQHFGRVVPLEVLREDCGVSRDGTKAVHMVEAARRYDLEASGRRYSKIESLYELDYPAILFWNRNHWVVLGGFKKGKALLSDPARGPRAVSLEELDLAYSGVVLTFTPGESFEPGGQKRSLVAAIWRRISSSRVPLAFIVLCGLALVLPGLLAPAFSKIFVDEYLIAERERMINPLLVAMAVTFVVSMVLTYLQERALIKLETRLALGASTEFVRHLLRLPVGFFAQRGAGEIAERVQMNDKVAKTITGRLATTAIDCLTMVFYALLLCLYALDLTLWVMALAAVNVAALHFAGRARRDASQRLLADRGKLQSTASYGLGMMETLKATGNELEFFSRWAGYQSKTLRSEQELQRLGDWISIVPPLVTALTTAMIFFVGGSKVMAGALTVGQLVAYQLLAAQFTRPLTNLVSFGSALQELEADMNRIDDVGRYAPEIQLGDVAGGDLVGDGVAERDVLGRDVGAKLTGKVELRGVTFGYGRFDPPLIKGFSLVVTPGQRIALVGASGSGKSTVARLVAGLLQPQKGEILFDDVPREQIPRRVLTNSLAMVDQEVLMFEGSIRDNLALWDATVRDARLQAAIDDAELRSMVSGREGMLDGRVAEGGDNFSGGQRQRLEIARSLVADPSILVLDEATSALDPITEQRIDDALRRRGCTCIIVAHRLSTIRDCDQIYVMDRGQRAESGTHAELLAKKGLYYRLMKAEG